MFRTKKRRHPMVETENGYEAPDIVYEGDLEIQAGSPLGLPDLEDLEEW